MRTLLIGLALICFSFAPGVRSEETPVLMCGPSYSQAELEGLAEAALSGVPEAAFNLQAYYFDNDSIDEAVYWAAMSTENGSLQGRYAYAFLLKLRGGSRDIARAKFHLKIAARDGHPHAASLLREIESSLRATKNSVPTAAKTPAVSKACSADGP